MPETASAAGGAGRGWRVVAWTVLIMNAVAVALFAVPATAILFTALTPETKNPEQFGAAMAFGLIGAVLAFHAVLALVAVVASWLVTRRFRTRPAGPGSIIVLALAGSAPLVLLVYLVLH